MLVAAMFDSRALVGRPNYKESHINNTPLRTDKHHEWKVEGTAGREREAITESLGACPRFCPEFLFRSPWNTLMPFLTPQPPHVLQHGRLENEAFRLFADRSSIILHRGGWETNYFYFSWLFLGSGWAAGPSDCLY